MSEPSAAGSPLPPAERDRWQALVVQVRRLRTDVVVVRLAGPPLPYEAGGNLAVALPFAPTQWRRLAPALPPNPQGLLEFHVRAVPGGSLSRRIVDGTETGQIWTMRDPQRSLYVDSTGRDVVLIAQGTGLAPMRAIIYELATWQTPPRTFLFVGDHDLRALYAADMLTHLAHEFDWLTVLPVVETMTAPTEPDPYYEALQHDPSVAAASAWSPENVLIGTLPEIIGTYGGAFRDQQVLLAGAPSTVAETVAVLEAAGTPARNIRYDA